MANEASAEGRENQAFLHHSLRKRTPPPPHVLSGSDSDGTGRRGAWPDVILAVASPRIERWVRSADRLSRRIRYDCVARQAPFRARPFSFVLPAGGSPTA